MSGVNRASTTPVFGRKVAQSRFGLSSVAEQAKPWTLVDSAICAAELRKRHLSGPSVFADQLNKTATTQIDGSNAGAGLFNT
jgi:hypothetical protein